MDDNDLHQRWPEVKQKLKQQYPQLTEEDLQYQLGQDTELLIKLKRKLNKNWKDIKEVLSLLG